MRRSYAQGGYNTGTRARKNSKPDERKLSRFGISSLGRSHRCQPAILARLIALVDSIVRERYTRDTGPEYPAPPPPTLRITGLSLIRAGAAPRRVQRSAGNVSKLAKAEKVATCIQLCIRTGLRPSIRGMWGLVRILSSKVTCPNPALLDAVRRVVSSSGSCNSAIRERRLIRVLLEQGLAAEFCAWLASDSSLLKLVYSHDSFWRSPQKALVVIRTLSRICAFRDAFRCRRVRETVSKCKPHNSRTRRTTRSRSVGNITGGSPRAPLSMRGHATVTAAPSRGPRSARWVFGFRVRDSHFARPHARLMLPGGSVQADIIQATIQNLPSDEILPRLQHPTGNYKTQLLDRIMASTPLYNHRSRPSPIGPEGSLPAYLRSPPPQSPDSLLVWKCQETPTQPHSRLSGAGATRRRLDGVFAAQSTRAKETFNVSKRETLPNVSAAPRAPSAPPPPLPLPVDRNKTSILNTLSQPHSECIKKLSPKPSHIRRQRPRSRRASPTRDEHTHVTSTAAWKAHRATTDCKTQGTTAYIGSQSILAALRQAQPARAVQALLLTKANLSLTRLALSTMYRLIMDSAEEGVNGVVPALAAELKRRDAKPIPLELFTRVGDTPLIRAVWGGHRRVAIELIEAGADPNACDRAFLRTPLMYAAWRGHVNLVRILVDAQADPSAKDAYSNTAIGLAIQAGHAKAASALIFKGSSVTASRHSSVSPPLVAAAARGLTGVVAELLTFKSAPDARNAAGCTALMVASRAGHVETVREIGMHCASNAAALVRTTDPYGQDALSKAVEMGHVDVACELLLLKADATRILRSPDPKHRALLREARAKKARVTRFNSALSLTDKKRRAGQQNERSKPVGWHSRRVNGHRARVARRRTSSSE